MKAKYLFMCNKPVGVKFELAALRGCGGWGRDAMQRGGGEEVAWVWGAGQRGRGATGAENYY